jgi:hypothetical protein
MTLRLPLLCLAVPALVAGAPFDDAVRKEWANWRVPGC